MALNKGPDLALIQTERLGFLALAGEARVRLTSPWSPAPSPNASLISIASRKGLVAAAGPDAISVATTDSVRKAFEAQKDGDSDVRPFAPQAKIPLPTRISHLAFTADEDHLIMAAEVGGGLAVYDVQALLGGSTQTSFQIPTNGEGLRALVPNPQAAKGELCAVVTDKGNLLMASMKEKNFVSGPNGQTLKTQASCVAWSNKGKQIIVGLGDGTIQQMTPEGDVKAQFPYPPDLEPNHFVSFLAWLENDVLLSVHVSTAQDPPQSVYHLITRQGQDLAFQRLTDPVDPFGSDKVPHHTVARLKDFPPNLQDLLIFSSTATPDIGLLTRSKTALSDDNITNTFATTELLDDSKRATLPMGDNMDTPLPIGTALDLSAKEPVYKPIPSDEMEQSPGPLPAYWVLNYEGVLSAWWIIYTESIRGGTTYPGIAAAQASASAASGAPSTQPPQTPQANPFGAPSGPSFGALSAGTGSAFGSMSALGAKPSVWGAQPASNASPGGAAFGSSTFGSGTASIAPKFGQPSFGTPSFGQAGGGAAFGQASGLGAKSSPWATGASTTSSPSFGQSGFATAAKETTGVFGSSSAANASGGFASFANKGGFASLGADNSSSGSNIFASSKPAADVSMDNGTNTSFPPATSKPAASSGGVFGATPFKLQSSFKPDPNAKEESVTPDEPKDGSSFFGSGFGSTLGEASKPAGSGLFGNQMSSSTQSTTPTSTPAPSKFFSQAAAPPQSGGLFGGPSKSSSGLFGSASGTSGSTPQVKVEAESPKPLNDIPDIPLPPDTTSKAPYPLGDSSSSSAYSAADSPATRASPTDAPLPPDFPSSNSKDDDLLSEPESPVDDAPLPPDPLSNEQLYDIKYDALPGQAKPKAAPPDDAPLPPDPTTNKKVDNVKLPPIPGTGKPVEKSPSIFGGAKASTTSSLFGSAKPAETSGSLFGSAKPSQASTSSWGAGQKSTGKTASIFDAAAKPVKSGFLFPTDLPPVSSSDEDGEGEDEVDEDEEQDEDGEGDEYEEGEGDDEEEDDESDQASEGSGIDVAKDLSPPSGTKDKTTPSITPGSSFGGLGGSFSTISKPEPERRSLFGEMGQSIPPLPQPNPVSPRSPSPVRGAIPSRLISDQKRSFSAPGMASQILGASRRPQSRGAPIVSKEALVDPRLEQQRRARARKEAEETQLLVDEEDDLRQAQLSAPVEPTLQLDEFIAHVGPLPLADDNIPAQVEAVYRDINAMIDTLGLNARSLTSFIKGHAEALRRDHRREADELANADDWTLGELEDLYDIISEDLVVQLSDARVVNVQEKIAECIDLQRDLARDRNKRNDLQKMINAKIDPDQALANRALPLTAEQAARQNDLRRDFARFTKLLAEAEEALTLLKAKIASANAANGKTSSTPTVEAIMRTIAKMTSMAEKRSGDIDVLENQMRKLRFASPGPLLGASTRSREGTPTPKKLLGSSMLFSPDRSIRESTPTRNSVMRHSVSASVSSIGNGMFGRTPPRKKMSGFGDAEKKAVKERKDRRAVVLGKLRTSVQKKGASVWAVDDME
ncbi:uncharacterized protein JN550_012659 [Neoarthrinium moseri]|uniref:uncharacterized protein n=1 Tax=Neoarthrinium moseri TaxID=1658444 RepID=UPI001FDDDF6F|nr:uncharacterized protein JN550_012659 [Neoarthrinium moseri]KAI1858449.1 hypothetical protein JN550_012659 [Neoarthrinium moseri]